MTSKSLKQAVYRGLINITFSENNDEKELIHRLIISAIVYNVLSLMLENDPGLSRDITSLASKYGESYKPIIDSMPDKYVVYKVLYNTVKSYNISSFIKMNDSQINEINKLFQNKTETKLFDINSFSQYMYKVPYTTFWQLERLRKIHYQIMVPIAEYYLNKNSILPSSIIIYNAEKVKDNPGKEISFIINGINPSSVVRDIKQDKQLIKKYIYDVRIEDEKVVIITN